MPRAPRLTGCEHPFFFDISWRPTAAREDPCFVVCSFFFSFVFRFLYFSVFVVSVRELCAHIQLCVATTARSNCLSPRRAPTLAFCVRQRDLSLLLLLLFRSSSPRRTAYNLLVSGSCGGGAESQHQPCHMTDGKTGLGRSDSDKGHRFPWPYLFILLVNFRRNGSKT